MKEYNKYSSHYIDDVVGTFLGSFVVVVVLVFGCTACRKKSKIEDSITKLYNT